MWTAFIVGLAAGIAATPHCLGMCGGFPLHLARSSQDKGVLFRQILFVLGKTFTYMFLGTLASAVGVILLKNTSLAPGAPALRITAGLLTVVIGLIMLGFRLPKARVLQNAVETGFIRSLYGGFLASPGPTAAFVLGLGVGLLPCPLPMGMLAAAAASHNIPMGIAGMAGVGIGTAPGLLAVGLFGAQLDRNFARIGMRAAGVIVICIGLLTLGRATGLVHPGSAVNKAVPPCCEQHTSQ